MCDRFPYMLDAGWQQHHIADRASLLKPFVFGRNLPCRQLRVAVALFYFLIRSVVAFWSNLGSNINPRSSLKKATGKPTNGNGAVCESFSIGFFMDWFQKPTWCRLGTKIYPQNRSQVCNKTILTQLYNKSSKRLCAGRQGCAAVGGRGLMSQPVHPGS